MGAASYRFLCPQRPQTMSAMRQLAALFLFAVSVNALKKPGTATAMAGLEGEACSEDEYGRYKEIVCKMEATCGCAAAKCELDWCADYVHRWKKEFGACLLKGCPADEAGDEKRSG